LHRELKTKDDQYLIDEYKNTGNKEYVGVLFERYTHLVFGVCMKYFRDEDEAKDGVMMIFEKLLTDLKKHEITYFKAWLHTVSKNHCLMKLRQAKKFVEFKDQNSVESGEDRHREDKIILEGRLTILEEGIKVLDPHQQICIRMFYIEQKSYQDITDHTGYDFNQVKSYIQNGKRNLKIYMEKNEKQ